MPNPKNPKLSLKVMINKQKTKVLFAEANSDFVDVLLSFLTLPLGRIVRDLQRHCGETLPAIGSLTTLYNCLHHLDSTKYFSVEGAKEMFLNPRSSFEAECRYLILDITNTQPAQHFACLCQGYIFPDVDISMYSDIAKCSKCCNLLNRTTSDWESPPRVGGDEGFTKKSSSFLISDDLRVVPVEPGFLQSPVVAGVRQVVQILDKLGVADTQGAELRILNFGIDDIMDLLKLSLISATPLTDLIIKNGSEGSTVAKLDPGILSHFVEKEAVSGSSKKMNLKVSLQKSTNRFMFAEAKDEFMELLFSFLMIPLGGVEFLLGGKSCLKCIDNLYRSVTDFINYENFTTPYVKNWLRNPLLAHGYIFDNQFLPLAQERPCTLSYKAQYCSRSRSRLSFKWVGGRGNYVKKPTVCFVTDDLTVAPTLASAFSILNGLGIALSDVKEMELQIGLKEALSIMRASLTSKTALTDALINPMLCKAPKLDK